MTCSAVERAQKQIGAVYFSAHATDELLGALLAEVERLRAVVKQVSELSPGHEYMATDIAVRALAAPPDPKEGTE